MAPSWQRFRDWKRSARTILNVRTMKDAAGSSSWLVVPVVQGEAISRFGLFHAPSTKGSLLGRVSLANYATHGANVLALVGKSHIGNSMSPQCLCLSSCVPEAPKLPSNAAAASLLCCRCRGFGGTFGCLCSSGFPSAAAAAQHGQCSQWAAGTNLWWSHWHGCCWSCFGRSSRRGFSLAKAL